jgi:hypothetical protein
MLANPTEPSSLLSPCQPPYRACGGWGPTERPCRLGSMEALHRCRDGLGRQRLMACGGGTNGCGVEVTAAAVLVFGRLRSVKARKGIGRKENRGEREDKMLPYVVITLVEAVYSTKKCMWAGVIRAGFISRTGQRLLEAVSFYLLPALGFLHKSPTLVISGLKFFLVENAP